MKLAMMRCCSTSIGLRYYESSTNAVLRKLGIEFIDVKELNCCGYPLKNFNLKAYLHASARDLALAEQRSLDLLTVCNCCYGSLKRAQHLFSEDSAMKDAIRESLNKEGLDYDGRIEAKHFLQVLHDTIGVEAIEEQVVRHFKGLKIAVHYGCHILRPKEIVQFDNPFAPSKFDRLVELTGAESVPWPTKLECCGSPLVGVNDELSMDLTEKKLINAKTAGADAVCVACSYCQYQFETVQKLVIGRRGPACALPSIVFPQLLGLSLGIDEEELGLREGQFPSSWVSAA
jgi:heterodisulfide reductase subunit B2